MKISKYDTVEHTVNIIKESNLTKKALMNETGISKSTIDKMGRGEKVSLDIIERICNHLNCNISDVIEHISE